MTQPQIELKACPNPECNSDAAWPEYSEINDEVFGYFGTACYIHCDGCGLDGPKAKTDEKTPDKEKLAEASATKWNALPRGPAVAPGLRDLLITAVSKSEWTGYD